MKNHSKIAPLFTAALLCISPRALAYIDRAVTLGGVVRESQNILLVEVEKFSRDKNAVILKKVRDLKGQTDAAPIKHQLAPQAQPSPRRTPKGPNPASPPSSSSPP